MEDFVRRFLTQHDVSCPDCGYNLRSCQSRTCPECGLRLTLALRSSRECRSWLVLVLSLSLLSGSGIQRWILEAMNGPPFQFLSLPLPIHWHVLNWFVMLSPALLAGALLRRRWFAHQPSPRQWILAAVPLAMFIVECLSLVR